MVARPAAAAVADSGLLIGHFTNDIQAVVRAAAVMPAAARRQHREGRAQVRFDYLDGNVHGVALAQSSASRLLDDAALSAVQTARYPAPPPQLRGRKLSLVVWIDFHLGGASPG
jgi:TonB family protein